MKLHINKDEESGSRVNGIRFHLGSLSEGQPPAKLVELKRL